MKKICLYTIIFIKINVLLASCIALFKICPNVGKLLLSVLSRLRFMIYKTYNPMLLNYLIIIRVYT